MVQYQSQNSISISSEENWDQVSSNYSPLSSRSSWSSNCSTGDEPPGSIAAQRLQRTYSIVDPVDAGVFDESECEGTLTRGNKIIFWQAAEELENEIYRMFEESGYLESVTFSYPSSKVDEDLVYRSTKYRKAKPVRRVLGTTIEPQHVDLIQYSPAEIGMPWPWNPSLNHTRSKSGPVSFHSRTRSSTRENSPNPAENHRRLRSQLPKLRIRDKQPIVSKLFQQPGRAQRYLEVLDGMNMRSRQNSIINYPIFTSNEEKISDFPKIIIGYKEDDILMPDTASQDISELRQTNVSEISENPGIDQKPTNKIFELDGNETISKTKLMKSPNFINRSTPVDIPENVTLALMTHVSSLTDLFSLALVSKQFFHVHKKHELFLMKNALFRMSPAAWELREMSPPWLNDWQGLEDLDVPVPEYAPTTYLGNHARDIYTLAKLKSLIILHGCTFLRRETINGLTGVDPIRSAEIDSAFWRIWIFCRIFGSGKGREANLHNQMDWLNGGVLAHKQKDDATILGDHVFGDIHVLFDPPAAFGLANGKGLTLPQLYDMSEIWNCCCALLQVVHDKCVEAREAGIFSRLDIPNDKEETMLEEWIYYVLSVGPSVLVRLISDPPDNSASTLFSKAKKMGLTNWDPAEDGTSRLSFLRDAISRTWKSRILAHPGPTAPVPQLTPPIPQPIPCPLDRRLLDWTTETPANGTPAIHDVPPPYTLNISGNGSDQVAVGVVRQPNRAERSAAKNITDAMKRGWRAAMRKDENMKNKGKRLDKARSWSVEWPWLE